jgi:hypothetical protein
MFRMSVTISGSDHSRPHPRVQGCFASIDFDLDDARVVNWSNGNAAILFELLGLGRSSFGEAPMCGAPSFALGQRSSAAGPVSSGPRS